MNNKVNIFGVKISSTTMDEVLGKIANQIQSSFKKPLFIVTVNPEFVIEAQKDEKFKQILNSADIAIADGSGLKLAGEIKEIIPGRKLVEKLLIKNYRVFFLGGKPGIAEKLASKYGGEADMGEKNIRQNETDRKRIVSKINKYAPEVLLVAYGAPAQEKWIASVLDQVQAKVVIGVGGTFDYLMGEAVAPPKTVEKLGMEWLWRLVHEPWRWRRQLKLVKYLGWCIKAKLMG